MRRNSSSAGETAAEYLADVERALAKATRKDDLVVVVRSPAGTSVFEMDDASEVRDEIVNLLVECEAGMAPQSAATRDLSEAEVGALRHGGIHLDGGERDASPSSAGLREWLQLVRDSYSTAQAARALRVKESRIRQRLGGERPSLYGFRREKTWLIPRFQIEAHALVPGLDVVVGRLDRGLHPVSVARWFQLPNPDLVDPHDEDKVLSPIAWLKSGGAPETAAELAADL